MPTLSPGYQVTSGLVLVRPLGRGGMGTVWAAHHEKLGIEVVVKLVSESRLDDDKARARFTREVTATIQGRGPHVVQTLDHGITEDGVPYLVMELLEGRDLAATLRARGPLPPAEVMHIIDGVASALTTAHEKGIVHRDIKPANVFLCAGSPRPFVKLVDFGIAKQSEDHTLTTTNAIVGTPSYMSPEQITGARVDARSDLWSLGVLAYVALTASSPFAGDSVASVVHAITTGPPPKATARNPALPVAVDAWMSRALARDPDQRFASAGEMADALAVALGTTARVGLSAAPPEAPPPPVDARATATHTFAAAGTTLGSAVVARQASRARGSRMRWPVLLGAIALAGVAIALVRRPAAREVATAPPPSAVVEVATAPPPSAAVELATPAQVAPSASSAPASPSGSAGPAATPARAASQRSTSAPRPSARSTTTGTIQDDIGF